MKDFLENRQRIDSRVATTPTGADGFETMDKAVTRQRPPAPPPQTAPAAVTETIPNPSADAAGPAPKLEVLRQGDIITKIILTCPGGERLEVECQY